MKSKKSITKDRIAKVVANSKNVAKKVSLSLNKDMIAIAFSFLVLITIGIFMLNLDKFFPVETQEIDSILESLEQRQGFSGTHEGTNPSAQIDMIFYLDYFCPHCMISFEDAKRVVNDYYQDVNVVIKFFPTQPGSTDAAIAAECAREQGKFWEFSEIMFMRSHAGPQRSYEDRAQSLNLDISQYQDCISSGRYRQKVYDDIDQANLAMVRGTPTIIINGEVLEGTKPYEVIKTQIDYHLSGVDYIDLI